MTSSASDTVSVIVPCLSPFAAVNWLGKFAVYNGAADFTFFMSKENEFKFKSFEDMYNSDSSGYTFKQGIANILDNAGNRPESDVFNMLHWYVNHYDAISNMANGYYANETVMFDVHKQIWKTKKFKHGDDIGSDASMSSIGPAFKNVKSEAFRAFIPTNDEMREGEPHPNKRDQVEKYAGSRRSSIMKYEQDHLFIQVAGQVKYAEDLLGKTVMIDMHPQEDRSKETLDKYYSGKYLVTAIEHVMSDQDYYVNLEVTKKRLKQGM